MCVIVRKPKGVEISNGTLRHCWQANKDGAGFMYAEDGKLVFKKGLMSFASFLREYQACNPKDKDMLIHFRYATHGAVANEQTHPFIIHGDIGVMHNGIITFENEITGYVAEEEDVELDKDEIEETLEAQMSQKAQEEKVEEVQRRIAILKDDKLMDVEVDKILDEVYADEDEEEKKELDNTKTPCNNTEEPVEIESDTQRFCSKIMDKLPMGFLDNSAVCSLLSQFLIHNFSVIAVMTSKGEIKLLGDLGSQYEEKGCWFSNCSWKRVKKVITWSPSNALPNKFPSYSGRIGYGNCDQDMWDNNQQ